MGCAEYLIFAGRFNGRHVVDRVFHLRGDEAVPDELIESILIFRQIMLDELRIERDIARANGLVAVLRVCLGLIAPGLTGIVFFAIAAADDLSGRGKRFFRDAKRVRSHVGDKADGTLFAKLHTFIELLGEHHRPLRRQVQLTGCFLLKARGNKGRCRIFPALRLFDALHRKGLSRDL